MSSRESPVSSFLRDVMARYGCRPSRLAAEIGVSHGTVGRWLSGKDIPNPQSCRKLAEYSGQSVHEVLSLAGHLPEKEMEAVDKWPEFREYVRYKYHEELGEDVINMVEDLIIRKRRRKYHGKQTP